MTETKGEILHEGTEWETIQFRKGFSSNFSVWHKDADGDVEFEIEDGDERVFAHLNQEDMVIDCSLTKTIKIMKVTTIHTQVIDSNYNESRTRVRLYGFWFDVQSDGEGGEFAFIESLPGIHDDPNIRNLKIYLQSNG